MRHRLIALPLAALGSLAFATVALGGAWAQVTVNDPAVNPPAGGETILDLDVLQHGVTPVSWPTLTVVATAATTGEAVRADARANGAEGSYIATIVFPSAGKWTLTFESADLEMGGSLALNVGPATLAAGAPVAAQPGVTAPAAYAVDVLSLALPLMAAVAALAVGGLLMRRGRATPESGVSVRT